MVDCGHAQNSSTGGSLGWEEETEISWAHFERAWQETVGDDGDDGKNGEGGDDGEDGVDVGGDDCEDGEDGEDGGGDGKSFADLQRPGHLCSQHQADHQLKIK